MGDLAKNLFLEKKFGQENFSQQAKI